MILDRSKRPKIYEVTDIPLPPCEMVHLDNGIPTYIINMGNIDAVRIEVIIKAGRPQEHKPTVARATAALLKEGTTTKRSDEIAEHFDYFGGNISTPFSLDTSSVVMHSLNKHLPQLLPVFAEVIMSPAFAEKELTTYVENNIHDLQVELSKSDVLAYRKFSEMIFGESHPYGYNSDEQSYKNLLVSDLKSFYDEHYVAENIVIIVSGKVQKDTIALLNQYLGRIKNGVPSSPFPSLTTPTTPQNIFIPKNDSSQNAITIGRKLFNRKHPDYAGLFVLTTILGGYFGSRLMENIREEKGYTYNIYASYDTLLHDGYFYISTEVGEAFSKATLTEIYKEIDVLQQELVGKSELKMVRNYLLGNMLNLIDGPFNTADLYKTFIIEDSQATQLEHLVHTIKTISAETLRELAQKYLQQKDLWQVVVGQ